MDILKEQVESDINLFMDSTNYDSMNLPQTFVSAETRRLLDEKRKSTPLIEYDKIVIQEYQYLLQYIKKSVDFQRYSDKKTKPCVVALDDTIRCRIVENNARCINEKGIAKRDQFCDIHKAVISKIVTYLDGKICSNENCFEKTSSLSAVYCKLHEEIALIEGEDGDDEEPVIDEKSYANDNEELSEKEISALKVKLIGILEAFMREMSETVTKVCYIGATTQSTIKRCMFPDHFKKKPLGFLFKDLAKFDSVHEIKFAEYFVISYLARNLGEKRLLNRVGGGGGITKTKRRFYTLYALTWTNDTQAIELASQRKTSNLSEMYSKYKPAERTLLYSADIAVALGMKQCNNLEDQPVLV